MYNVVHTLSTSLPD